VVGLLPNFPENMGTNLNFGDYFDNNGNITELEHVRDITWNYRDNISSATMVERADDKSDVEYYVYDSSGERIRKVRHTWKGDDIVEIEEKIYLGAIEIKRIRQINSSSLKVEKKVERTSLHIMDDQSRIAIVHNWTLDTAEREVNSQADIGENKTRYQYGNHLGSASLELDILGNLISYEEHFPYGGTSFTAGKSQKEVKLKEYRYTGKERDDFTGLYYYGARYYAPWLGRWMSADPSGPQDGLNLYVYVGNNPLGYVDPNGKEKKTITIRNDISGKTTTLSSDDYEGIYEAQMEGVTAWVARKVREKIDKFSKGVGDKVLQMEIDFINSLNIESSWLREQLYDAAALDATVARMLSGEIIEQPLEVLDVITLPDDAIEAVSSGYEQIQECKTSFENEKYWEGTKKGGMAFLVVGQIFMQGGGKKKKTKKKDKWSPSRNASFTDLMDDLDDWSLTPIGDRQKKMIHDKLSTIKQRSKKQTALIRKKGFSEKRQKELIGQWELETGEVWPAGATPHHIIPLKSGGANEWWNLAPVKHPHTGTIHGKGSALRKELPYSIEEGTITNLKKSKQ